MRRPTLQGAMNLNSPVFIIFSKYGIVFFTMQKMQLINPKPSN
jgi:hypothetical protein